MARAGGSVGKTSTILLYITTSDLCCGLRGLYEGDAILAGKVLVAHAHSSHSSVILLGKNVECSPFNLNFFRNGDKWNENLSPNSTLLLDFWICFSRSREPKRLKSVLGGFLVRHSNGIEHFQNCCRKLDSDLTEITCSGIKFLNCPANSALRFCWR